jgi:hypothetical protein
MLFGRVAPPKRILQFQAKRHQIFAKPPNRLDIERFSEERGGDCTSGAGLE